ncbi:kinase-like domain-containing protein [Rhizophagus irregularis DAOM 181602=DAOM 197198]|uniref:Kinase-like domain-containing protein n=1 Tax=Rhizophagus irregularis (strain DAOM 181602 / DAOM 197198 / MUCL 43194) TaxID=747089 RepID=A0A2P4PPA1_RHIID|nr:kinase-like domain-containing protein [Rhizophagus irregularis DAOM 181602=DAOM 197198]POG67190.1 kinase-like domain-containing protein [Rhizophagus irregularis DAOM 181602=DAOM 197198]|eukprot:XP_025174056.1 kinase-like domain-containing protein [Rhizophagus irregularis DAOM 181602=DAOM 197198]
MSNIRKKLIRAVLIRSFTSIDYNIYVDFHEQYEFRKQFVLADNSLTEEEKTEAIRIMNKNYDRNKIFYNEGIRRVCENCNQKCLATLYCEYCVRNYLKYNFSNWTSGNNVIDNLIKSCQMETFTPDGIIEWIPYNNLENIKYLTKGGFSDIYTAYWIDGKYDEWDSKKQQLIRLGTHAVILKELKNVENASQSWFEEQQKFRDCSMFWFNTKSIKWNYLLVIMKFNMNLREYLQQNHNQLTWNERIKITFLIIDALYWIHKENSIHRDLHSGNILYSQFNDNWQISDLGFCGPADKPSTSIYGNLPYIAPEVINGKGYTFRSDIYSIAMLMWEISFGQPPFMNYEHDYILAIDIIDGIRPKIVSEIPLEYKSLMEQCWEANQLKRPDTNTLYKKIKEIKSYYQNNPNELPQLITKIDKKTSNILSSKLFTSKIHKFENLPEPKNATEEEQKALYISRSYDFSLSDNTSNLSKSGKINFKENDSKESSRLFKKLKVENVDVQNDHDREIMQQRSDISVNDEVQDNPNLHSEEKDKTPDDGFQINFQLI